MQYIFGILGIIASALLIKYREKMGDIVGEADWMGKLGGIYNVIIIFAVFIFFWSVATLTNTTQFLFAPIKWLIPGLTPPPAPPVPEAF